MSIIILWELTIFNMSVKQDFMCNYKYYYSIVWGSMKEIVLFKGVYVGKRLGTPGLKQLTII